MQQTKTTRKKLQERKDASLVLSSSEESFNSTSLKTLNNRDDSKLSSHSRSEYNSNNGGSMSTQHSVFVLSIEGKPLTPTTSSKARKLLKSKQAKPVWNKLNQFGIQMLVDTRKETPKCVLGQDWGTKFEGYSVIVDKENNLNVMWKLPDKKKLMDKLEDRRILRRARRQRNCRRRESRFDNRSRIGFIAPSQMQIVQSRLKCINELFKCYPVSKTAIEDIKFNHRDKRWGKNFSTVEVGKQFIFKHIRNKIGSENVILFNGFDTKDFREKLGLKKSSNKSAENFNSHCVDSFSIANELSPAIPDPNVIIVDDTYRFVRRQLHDTQPSKGGIRTKYSTGSFKGVKKGTMCNWGQICGGTKNMFRVRNYENIRIGRTKVDWLSHHFKCTRGEQAIPPTNKFVGSLA